MQEITPAPQTILFLSIFLLLYLAFLFHRTVKGKVDLYDFFLLSLVALLPCLFAFFPKAGIEFTHFLGVKYPFVVLFGLLFFVVFFYLNRLVVRLNDLRTRERALAQEMALLRQQLESDKKNK